MKTTLIDLFTSKKFLAALSAIILYLAGRFGFALDPAALDRIFAALLVYVGAQGLADNGKSAAQILSGPPAVRPTPATSPILTVAGPVALLLAVLTLGAATLPACSATTRAREAAGATAVLDCAAPDLHAAAAELLGLATPAMRALITGTGHVDTAGLKAIMAALKADATRCALDAAIAIVATPAPVPPRPDAPFGAALQTANVGELRGAYAATARELGWPEIRR